MKSARRVRVIANRSTLAAAGYVAELRRLGDSESAVQVEFLAKRHAQGDLYTMKEQAFLAGVPAERLEQYAEAHLEKAARLLDADNGAAWHRVTEALLQRETLTPEEVRSLVGACKSLTPNSPVPLLHMKQGDSIETSCA